MEIGTEILSLKLSWVEVGVSGFDPRPLRVLSCWSSSVIKAIHSEWEESKYTMFTPAAFGLRLLRSRLRSQPAVASHDTRKASVCYPMLSPMRLTSLQLPPQICCGIHSLAFFLF